MSARSWFWSSVLVYLVVLAWAALVLPDGPVPLHFGAEGAADRFGSRTEALVSLGLVGLGTAVLMRGITRLLESGRISFQHMNVPHKPYWSRPENQQRAREMMAEDMDLVAAMTMGFLAVVALIVVDAALGDGVLAAWFWVALVGYLLLVTAWVVRMYRGRYRPPEEA